VKDKIKEKIPGVGGGGGNKEHNNATSIPGAGHHPTTTATHHPAEPTHEKKGILDKIKDKLPGHHSHH
jgi:hypothetical protein